MPVAIPRVMQRPDSTALLVGALALATILGAWAFELAGYAPCKLCLQQRWPYYLAIPVAAAVWMTARAWPDIARAMLALVAVAFVAGAVLGGYHTGVEWGLWPGPTDCAAGSQATGPAQVGDFLQQLGTAKVVSCSEPALKVFSLSLAAWNTVISAGLAAMAALALLGTSRHSR